MYKKKERNPLKNNRFRRKFKKNAKKISTAEKAAEILVYIYIQL